MLVKLLWPVHVAEEVTDLDPISVGEYIEAQAADPWCQFMATNDDEAREGDSNATIVDSLFPSLRLT